MEASILDLFKKSCRAEWTSWREQVSVIPEFPGVDLRNVDLRGWPLAGIKLVAADLRNADLRDADLTGADLTRANLAHANLSGARLAGAKLNGAFLNGASLRETDFTGAELEKADLFDARFHTTNFQGAALSHANLAGAHLREVDFTSATLCQTNLTDAEFIRAKLCRAILHQTRLERARFIGVDLDGADIREARVYGIAVWDLQNAQSAVQRDLLVTPTGMREIRVDDLEMAQFVYMLLRNEKLRNVIDVMTTKAVLILGHFTPRRKAVLDSMREALRDDGHLPILFDFKPSQKRKLRETIRILAGLSSFVIADLTSAKGVISELEIIVAAFPSLPVQPVLHVASTIGSLLEELRENCPWLQPGFCYRSREDLLANLKDRVIQPARDWRPEKKKLAVVLEENAKLKSRNGKLESRLADLEKQLKRLKRR